MTKKKHGWIIAGVALAAALAVWIMQAVTSSHPPAAPGPAGAAPSQPPASMARPGSPSLVVGNESLASIGADRPAFTVTPVGDHGPARTIFLAAPDLHGEAGPLGYRLKVSERGTPMPGGAPDLPTLFHAMPGIPGMNAQVEIKSVTYREIPDVQVAPAPSYARDWSGGEPGEVVRREEPDPSIYGVDAYWPAEVLEVEEIYQGTNKWTRLAYRPVRYNPVAQTLLYAETVQAELTYEPEAETAPSAPRTPQARTVADPLAECPSPYTDPDLLLPPMTEGIPSEFAVRRAGAAFGVDAIYKITTDREGIYKITWDDLKAANGGVDPPGLDPAGSQIRLFHRDREVAIHVETDPVDGPRLLFYAEDYSGWYSDENVYWLGFGPGGKRMVEVPSPPTESANEVTFYYEQVSEHANNAPRLTVAPAQEEWDHWYAAFLNTTLGVPYLTWLVRFQTEHSVASEPAKICVEFQGLTDSNHDLQIRMRPAGTVDWTTGPLFQWSGDADGAGSPFSGSAILPNGSWLGAQATEIRAELVGSANTTNSVLAESLTLLYARSLVAHENNYLHFVGAGGGMNNYHLQAFRSGDVYAFEISDPTNVVLLTGFETATVGPGNVSLRFGRTAMEREAYCVAEEQALRTPRSIQKTVFRDLAHPDGPVDYILICPPSLRDSAYELLAYRHLKGFHVLPALVEDVYNEFAFGIQDARAIRQFLGYAFHHWPQSEPPIWVLLVGNATWEPALENPSGGNLLPTLMGYARDAFSGVDARFAQVNGGDGFADMSVGRIPVRVSEDLDLVLSKIRTYESFDKNLPFRSRGIVVAGDNEKPGDQFSVSADKIAMNMFHGGVTDVEKEYRPSTSEAEVISAFNRHGGCLSVAYFGHGRITGWNGDPLLDVVSSVGQLTNTYLPVALALTCQSGFYLDDFDLESRCLAEALLYETSYGAIGSLAATSFTLNTIVEPIAAGFYGSGITSTGGPPARTLGEAVQAAYLSSFVGPGGSSGVPTDVPELSSLHLLGDPGLIVNP